MRLPSGDPPWFGLDSATLRFLEIHQTRAVALPGRAWRDLGDSVMLFSAGDSEPFFNRLSAVRWPSEPAAFEARLGEAMELFRALERRPYVWVIPGLSTPPDIVDRLRERGFEDLGGGHDMLLVREPDAGRGRGAGRESLSPGLTLEHWHDSPEPAIRPRAEVLAGLIEECFGVARERHQNLVLEIGLTLTMATFHAYVLRLDGEPVATGQRYTFDGASYLSSICTRRSWRGRGYGAIVTRALIHDSLADDCSLVYLGVHAHNQSAIRLYEREGFAILGPRSADMLLAADGAPAR